MAKTPYKDRWISKVERFNKEFPPGTPVVYHGRNGLRIHTEIRYPAVILCDGFSAIWLKGLRDYVGLDRVVVKK